MTLDLHHSLTEPQEQLHQWQSKVDVQAVQAVHICRQTQRPGTAPHLELEQRERPPRGAAEAQQGLRHGAISAPVSLNVLSSQASWYVAELGLLQTPSLLLGRTALADINAGGLMHEGAAAQAFAGATLLRKVSPISIDLYIQGPQGPLPVSAWSISKD